MPCTVIVSGFWGDEGKGKVASYLALADKADVAVRSGSINAGHTVVYEGQEYKLRMVPSAFVCKRTKLYLGPGANIYVPVFLEEVGVTGTYGRIWVDPHCSVITDEHKERDQKSEYLAGTIETTGQGVGPAVEDRVKRIAKIAREEPKLAPFLVDVPVLLNDAIDKGEVVFVEGTQGFYLSLYYGTYPYVTSRDTSTSGVCSEVGIPPTKVDEVILVLKSYMTRVGRGPLPGELPPDEALAKGWIEVATVTGRTRRAAPFDFNLARRAAVVDGATQIALTKLDVLFDCAGVRKFEELPKAAIDFVNEVEEKVKVPVTLIGTGPDISDIIDRRKGYFER